MPSEHLSQHLFDNITVSDLIKDVYVNRNKKNDQIEEILSTLSPLIDGNTAFILGPVVNSCIASSIKNDEQLVKLLTVVQKIIGGAGETGESSISSLSNSEISELVDNAMKTLNNCNTEINDLDIDSITKDAETAILSIQTPNNTN